MYTWTACRIFGRKWNDDHVDYRKTINAIHSSVKCIKILTPIYKQCTSPTNIQYKLVWSLNINIYGHIYGLTRKIVYRKSNPALGSQFYTNTGVFLNLCPKACCDHQTTDLHPGFFTTTKCTSQCGFGKQACANKSFTWS